MDDYLRLAYLSCWNVHTIKNRFFLVKSYILLLINQARHGAETSRLIFHRLEPEHGDEEKHQQLQGSGDTVGQEIANAHKDATRFDDARDDGGKTCKTKQKDKSITRVLIDKKTFQEKGEYKHI